MSYNENETVEDIRRDFQKRRIKCFPGTMTYEQAYREEQARLREKARQEVIRSHYTHEDSDDKININVSISRDQLGKLIDMLDDMR